MVAVITLILSLFFGTAYSTENKEIQNKCKTEAFYKERERGWFWKEICKEKKKEEVAIPWDKLNKMPISEIKKLREKLLEKAIMDPTYENVLKFRKLELWMARKARKFTEVNLLISMTNPEIAEYSGKRPSASFARRVQSQIESEARKRRIGKYLNKMALMVIKDETCVYCRELRRVLETFVRPYGIEIVYIERIRRPNLSRKLGVYMVPDTFIVWRGKNNRPYFIRIATGLVDAETILNRINLILQGIETRGEKFLAELDILSQGRYSK